MLNDTNPGVREAAILCIEVSVTLLVSGIAILFSPWRFITFLTDLISLRDHYNLVVIDVKKTLGLYLKTPWFVKVSSQDNKPVCSISAGWSMYF